MIYVFKLYISDTKVLKKWPRNKKTGKEAKQKRPQHSALSSKETSIFWASSMS
uniref:Uncharacterized protein n=1 Tax=Setaria italica TaxID=4555 RepID=K4AHZ5_SETIT